MRRVFVLGSINMDLTMYAGRMPKLGESVLGHGFAAAQGGKGANQAAACAKLGCECHFLGAVGEDSFGADLVRSLSGYGVLTAAVQRRKKVGSGTCMIIVDEKAKDNYLLVDLGANAQVNAGRVVGYLRENASAGDLFLTQLEINPDAVAAGCAAAKELGMYVILNPAPAANVGPEILSYVDLIVPNETEAEFFTSRRIETEADAEAVGEYLRRMGAKETIVTLGARGCVYAAEGRTKFYPAQRAEAVDPTSAGDTFIGGLAAKLCRGETMEAAIGYAAKCSAITVARRGAAASIPTAREVEEIWNL